MSSSKHRIILTAQGSDSANMLGRLADICAKNKCHILESKFQKFGEDLALLMLIEGSWHAIAKLEDHLPQLNKTSDLVFSCRRTQMSSNASSGLPYQAQLIASDRPGILSELCNFFSKNGIQVDECSAETYLPSRSETKMCQLQINIRIPTKSHIATLRDTFMAYCEELNLDALLEPLK